MSLKNSIQKTLLELAEQNLKQKNMTLDKDEVDDIVRYIYFEMHLMNANISYAEYQTGIDGKNDIFIYKKNKKNDKELIFKY